MFMLNFEEIIIPSLVYDESNQKPITESLKKVLDIFRTIVWIAYSPQKAQEYYGIKLLLRYKCFQLSLAIQKLPSSLKLVDLYLHVILSHFPDFFDISSFFIPSTEPLEALFVTTKRTKHSTNRQRRNNLKKIMQKFENPPERCGSHDDHNLISRDPNYKFSSYIDTLSKLVDVSINIPADNDQDQGISQ